MFGQLEDIERRFEEVLNELSEPGTTGDQKRFQKLMKEQADLTPLVETYREYKKSQRDAQRRAFRCKRGRGKAGGKA